jgi:hypothetical protein
MSQQDQKDTWQLWWDARQAALEAILGPADEEVFHALLPLYLGGDADVLRFHPPGMGVAYVTSDLIGDNRQLQNDLGNFELMICLRYGDNWAPNLISRLARYTFEAYLQPWETMEIGVALPEGSAITAFAFVPHARFKVLERDCGLLLCLGITADESKGFHERDPQFVVERLKQLGVYPFTELQRGSAVLK